MKRVTPALLVALTLATCSPAVAVAMPMGPPSASEAGGARVERSSDGAGGEQLAIALASAFVGGVLLGVLEARRRRRRSRAVATALMHEPIVTLAPEPEPAPADDDAPSEHPSEPEPVLTPEPLKLVAPSPRQPRTTPARERHVELYDAEYAQQLIRVQRLRKAFGARVARGGAAAATSGGRHERERGTEG